MLSKKKKRRDWGGTLKKVFLANILLILLWSRLLSSLSAVNEVHASFSTEINRGKINLPYIENQEQVAVDHINNQKKMAKVHGVRLQKLTEQDRKVTRVRKFYQRWNSPMAANAQYIVEVSELFGLDYRLIPAISIVESSGGRYCFRPYNAFGWGKQGFNNFNEAIYTVARGLAYGYKTSNPNLIAPVYNPVTPDAWAAKVSGLMAQV